MTKKTRTARDREYLTNLEPVTRQFVETLGDRPPFHTLSPSDARKLLSEVQAGPCGRPSAVVEDLQLPAGPGGSIPVRIVRPKGDGTAYPVVMYFHGGGWMIGDADTHDRLVRELAVGAQAAVVVVGFTRTPEASFPAPVEEAYAATAYVAAHADALNLDASRLAVVGDGTGGNMAVAVALLAKQHRKPKITFQVLFYPVTDATFRHDSYRAYGNGPWITKQDMQWFWDAYLPDLPARADATAAPLDLPVDALWGLPDALIIVAENDVVRDEGEAFARKLTAAGVRVMSVRFNGTIHDFVMLNALSDTPAARAAVAQAVACLRVALE